MEQDEIEIKVARHVIEDLARCRRCNASLTIVKLCSPDSMLPINCSTTDARKLPWPWMIPFIRNSLVPWLIITHLRLHRN